MVFIRRCLVWGSVGGVTYGTANYWYDRGTGGSQMQSVQLLRDFYFPEQRCESQSRVMAERLGLLTSTRPTSSTSDHHHKEKTINDRREKPVVSPTHDQFDVVIIGGGIVGLAVAREVRSRYPTKTVAVIEKEPTVAVHQSSHNSGVIHAGIYDQPDSLKTKLCVAGNQLMFNYCRKNKLPVKNVGKLVVAVNEEELATLASLHAKALANGLGGSVRLLTTPEEIKKLEPSVEGLQALYCPSTGIVDFGEVARHILQELQKGDPSKNKFTFIPNFQVEAIGSFYHLTNQEEAAILKKNGGVMPPPETRDPCSGRVAVLGREPGQCGPTKVVEGKKLITCGGLHMDSIARMAGGAHNPTVVPFRGRYYELSQSAKDVVSANVYPVPKQGGIPVGVHFTPTVSVDRGNQTIIGPGAAFSPHKEGYRLDKFDWTTMMNVVFSKANWSFLSANYSVACEALVQDMSRAAFIADARRLVPSLQDEDVVESYAGVMAQCFGSDGKPISDFLFEATHCPDFETPPLGNLALLQREKKEAAATAGGSSISGWASRLVPNVPYLMSSLTSKLTGAAPVDTTVTPSHTATTTTVRSSSGINNAFHVRNAPSPAATCAFSLAAEIVDQASGSIGL